MSSPVRSVAVRLSMDPSSYIAGASRAAGATTALDREVAKVGGTASTSMERAASGAGKTEGAFGKLNQSAGALGFTLGGLAGVGTALAAGLSVKWAGDYQSALTKLATTAGESQQNLSMVGKGMLDMAGQVGIGADELAKGMYTVESSGIHGADALNVLKAAAQGARQENADLSKVTDAVTTALHDYNLPASDAAKVTSQLITAVSHGKTTFDELTGAMHSVTPLAAALHVPLADVAGVLSSMTASGESADQAAQNMADTLRHLQNPTATMTAELGQLGITSSDLSTQLSTKGLSGTLQGISDAIMNKLDPATQKVLLPAFNQSKTAAQDLQIMLSNMPPALAKVSQGLLEGTTSQGEYRKAAQALGGQAGVLGDNFLSLYKSSDGFSNILKSGSPAAQVYTAALQKAVGTSAGLTVALQVTGEHAASTNAAIKDIAGSAAQADGSIKGWSEVQGNFNQQLAQAEAHLKSMAIEAGQHMLPALTGAFGYVNRDVLPGIEGLASAVSSAAHWFSELPAPIKDTAEALGILALANKVGVFSALESGAGKLVSALGGVASGAKGAFTSMEGLRSAGSGLANLFGGPWVLATAGAALGIMAIKNAVDQHDEAVKKATRDVQSWQRALVIDPAGGPQAASAAAHLADLQKQIDGTRAKLDELTGATTGADTAQRHFGAIGVATSSGAVQTQKDRLADLIKELDSGSEAWQKQLASMTPVEVATARVAAATKDLHDAQAKFPANSDEVSNAAHRLADAQSALAYQTNLTNDASKTQLQRLQDLANKQLGAVNSGLAAQQAQLQFSDAMAELNAHVTDGTLKGNALTEAQNSLAQSAISAAQAAGQSAKDQATANGVTDTAQVVNAAMLKSLQDNEKFLTGPAKDAIDQQIRILQGATVQTGSLTDAISKMGLTNVSESDSFRKEWGNNVQVLHGATQAQVKDLQGLGYTVMTLPNHEIVVGASTKDARNALTQLTNDYAQYSINVGVKVGSGTFARAGGGPVWGAGSTTSDSIPAMLSNREWVIKAASADKYGPQAMAAVNAGTATVIPHLAGGGPVTLDDMYLNAHVGITPASLSAAGSAIRGQVSSLMSSATSGGAGGAARWAGVVLQALAMLGQPASLLGTTLRRMNQESGGNQFAINLWDSNAKRGTPSKGLMQVIDPTFRANHFPGTSWDIYDPLANLTSSMLYAERRYGSLAAAYNRMGGYETGTDYVRSTGPAVLHQGEAVLTAKEAEVYRAGIRSREVSGRSGAGSSSPRVTVNARVFVGDREITDIARVEAEAVMVGALNSITTRGDYSR